MPTENPLDNAPLCPTCHSKVSPTGKRKQGADGTDSDGNPVPAWSGDPILTPTGLNGKDFIGSQFIDVASIKEIQDNRKAAELDLGVTPPTEFTPIEKGIGFVQATQIIELRISTERILDAIGTSLSDYFSLDANGGIQPPGPHDTPNKTEWTEVVRGKAFNSNKLNKDILFAGNTQFFLTGTSIQATPAIPDNTFVKGIHIEDLRHPISTVSSELFSSTQEFHHDTSSGDMTPRVYTNLKTDTIGLLTATIDFNEGGFPTSALAVVYAESLSGIVILPRHGKYLSLIAASSTNGMIHLPKTAVTYSNANFYYAGTSKPVVAPGYGVSMYVASGTSSYLAGWRFKNGKMQVFLTFHWVQEAYYPSTTDFIGAAVLTDLTVDPDTPINSSYKEGSGITLNYLKAHKLYSITVAFGLINPSLSNMGTGFAYAIDGLHNRLLYKTITTPQDPFFGFRYFDLTAEYDARENLL